MTNIIKAKISFNNEIRCIMYDKYSGKRVHDTGWYPNLITDYGMDSIGNDSGFAGWGCIGDGVASTDEAVSTLTSFLGSGSGAGTDNGLFVQNPVTPWEYSKIRSKRVDAGVGTGLISETGLGTENDGTDLFNRQAVPIPFDKQATFILDVLYRQTVWPMIGDVLADITIDGVIYKTITRGANYDAVTYKTPWSVMGLGGGGTRGYSGDIGATPADWPSGTFGSGVGASRAIAAYIPGSYYIDLKTNYVLSNFNVGGIHAFTQSFNRCYFQTSFHVDAAQSLPEFDPIPKTNTKIGDCTFRMSWARH